MRWVLNPGRLQLLGVCLAVLVIGRSSSAQSSYELTSGSSPQNSPTTVTVIANLASPVQGWSMGICHDSTELQVNSATLGADSQAISGSWGAGPQFTHFSVTDQGVTHGAVICLGACAPLPAGNGYSLLDLSYTPLGSAGTLSEVDFCATLGTPPITNVVVVDAQSIAPLTTGGTILVESSSTLRIGIVEAAVGQTASVPVLLTNAVPLSGIQIACNYAPTDLSYDSFSEGASLVADFVSIANDLALGEFGVGILVDLSPPIDQTLPPGADAEVIVMHFTVSPSATAPQTSPIQFASQVGVPPLANRVVVGVVGETPNLIDGAVEVLELTQFVRANCNRDPFVDISDGIYHLQYLFANGPTPGCLDACDTNDDGFLDTSDAVFLFSYVFADGSPPPAPFPDLGPDPTETDIFDCVEF